MCGITGFISKEGEAEINLSETLIKMNRAIAHRGPDGEGFMLANKNDTVAHFGSEFQSYRRRDLNYIPKSFISNNSSNYTLGFAHRRLSILDLSETGHQPMCDHSGNYWITFNGEIYNYLELKQELKQLGHHFISESDTEVVIHAYIEWGYECVNKFNGMWAFCLYDKEKQICFASRDRFGVKPFYYHQSSKFFVFASEQKAFIKSGLLQAKINPKALHNYITNGLLENETNNFFEGITELWPGNNLIYNLHNHSISIQPYYHLKSHLNLSNDYLSDNQLIDKIKQSLEYAVKIRLRSDVEVGTCLSGGIDSSALAVTMSEISGKPIHCFTSVFKGQSMNEERFADSVANKIHAKYFKTEPNLDGFVSEADDLIYSQDVPIWSTSTYAQYKVMALAAEKGIKVVLDGQGADELFGGYHHHFTAKWNNLLKGGKYATAIKEISSAGKTISASWLFYLKETIKKHYHHRQHAYSEFIHSDFLKSGEIENPSLTFYDLNEVLIDDIYRTRLKSFLKCEDRCGMWHSVESRTPFSDDVELINLMFSFNGNRKIQNGVSKYLLREAVKDKLPVEIYTRYDKKGFETPMQLWMKQLKPMMVSEIKSAGLDFIKEKNIEKFNTNKTFDYQLLFKLFVLSRWLKVFSH